MATKTQQEIYKNVELKGFRTKKIIDIIIKKVNEGLSTKEIAEIVGVPTYHPLVGIIRKLNTAGYVTLKSKTSKQLKTVKLAKNTFANYCGSGKEKARNLIADAIIATKRRNSNILTLPAENWLMEKNILEKKRGYKFTAVERDKETYKRMLRKLVSDETLLDSVVSTSNSSVSEVIVNDGEDTYSSMILDYCGFIDSFYDEINDIMRRNLVKKGGFMTITLAENDRSINNSLHANGYTNRFINTCYANKDVTGEKVTNDLVNNLVFNNNR